MGTWMRVSACCWLAAACKFPELPPIDEDATTAGDAADQDGAADAATDAVWIDAPPDAALPCTPSTVVCDDATGVFTSCSSAGIVELQFICSLGCASAVERCIEVDPVNGLAPSLDQARDLPTSLNVVFTGASTVNTVTGVVFNGPTSINVPSDMVNGIRVFMLRSLTVPAGVTLRVLPGGPAVAFAVGGDVLVEGLLDVSADLDAWGPGGNGPCAGGQAHGGIGYSAASPAASPGGGGAGGAQHGATGGRGGSGAAGGTGGIAGGVSLVPLHGGCLGGVGTTGINFSDGGGGGGAVQITSRTSITVRGNGIIDASGGGGRGAPQADVVPGSGGGAGGAILLEAPQVVLDGSGVVLSTKGGGGAAASSSGDGNRAGADGGSGPSPAPGGTATGRAAGGAGGVSPATSPAPGIDGAAGAPGGGGGGAGGVVGIRTSTGVVNPQNGATIRSALQVTPLSTRLVP